MGSWKLEDISWNEIDPAKVDFALLRLAKAASLVEYNSADYVTYLHNVFHDDPDLKQAFEKWGDEERQHGLALRRWAEHVDPAWDFERSFAKFLSVYRIPVDAKASVRGSRARELVARCLVETGTSTYYSALADASAEPVFRRICKLIAADEIHHYKLFYNHLQRYAATEGLSRLARLKTTVERSLELEDEELALAFACANYPDREILKSDFKTYAREFLPLTYKLYRRPHIAKAVRLVLQAAGLPTRRWLASGLEKLMGSALKVRRFQAERNMKVQNIASFS